MRDHATRLIGFFWLTAGLTTSATPAQATMKAIVHHEFGSPDVLRLEEVEKPVPGDAEVLVKVRAASINPLDWHYMEGTPYVARLLGFGLRKPNATRLGVDFAGTVEAVGKSVTRFKPGDEVFGGKLGALAEYVCVADKGAIVAKPAELTFEQAASLPIAGLTALQALRDSASIRPGQSVLINGASGGVGTFAVQIAKSMGATVTGVCSTRNLDMVRSLGADRVIDYTKDDFTQGAERYDVVLDNVANRSLLECRRILNPGGRYVLVGGGGLNEGRWVMPLIRPMKAAFLSQVGGRKMGMMLAQQTQSDLATLGQLTQAGKLKPVIDRRYKLRDVPQAIGYLEEGHARGKVVIDVEDDGAAATPSPAPAGGGNRTGAGLVAFVLIGTLVGVTIVPIVAAFVLNHRFRQVNPSKRGYRWGYYFALMSVVASLGLAAALELGVVAFIVVVAIYAALAWLFAARRRWAWIALTVLSFNPLVWIINPFYLWRRWSEDAVRTPRPSASS